MQLELNSNSIFKNEMKIVPKSIKNLQVIMMLKNSKKTHFHSSLLGNLWGTYGT
jgi:ABC-type polysaccharide/polyol phosphate export permease